MRVSRERAREVRGTSRSPLPPPLDKSIFDYVFNCALITTESLLDDRPFVRARDFSSRFLPLDHTQERDKRDSLDMMDFAQREIFQERAALLFIVSQLIVS